MRTIIFIIICGVIGFGNSVKAQTGSNFPITLNAPYHLDTIDNKRPTLIWQCDLASIITDPRVDMQLVLVEKDHGQPISEALIMNTALYSGYGLNDATFPFPSSEEDLIPGHTYAWQVIIMMNGSPIVQSEQWEFTIRNPRRKEGQYIKLVTNLNGSIYKIETDKINFVIEDKGKAIQKCTIRKTADGNETIIVDEVTKKNTNRDFGYYQVDLQDIKLKDGNYVLEVWTNSQKYSMQFYFVK